MKGKIMKRKKDNEIESVQVYCVVFDAQKNEYRTKLVTVVTNDSGVKDPNQLQLELFVNYDKGKLSSGLCNSIQK